MLAEWSAECGADDPVLVIPWEPEGECSSFIDLRENPYDLDQIPEIEQHPPLMQALRALNAPRSPLFTAKCDCWPLDEDTLAPLLLELDLTPSEAPNGFGSYIDLLWRERTAFVSAAQQEQRLTRLTRLATAIYLPHASLECTLRPAFVDLTGPQEGFAFTVYVKAVGTDQAHAYGNWSQALEAVTGLLRSKDFATP